MSKSSDTWCKHRTPFDEKKHPVCKVGVNYHQFDGPFRTKPCLGETEESRARCAQYTAYTPEELAEKERQIEASLDRMLAATIAIREATGGKKGVSGKIPCPTCAKPLHYSIAGNNGHIHAGCETPGCVRFLQ